MFTETEAKEAREDAVDLLEEARELALSRTLIYQQTFRCYHSRKVSPRVFHEGDLVLRLVQHSKGRHKLSPPWEGPFNVSKAMHNDSYYLVDAQDARKDGLDRPGQETQRRWNVALLRPFYSWRVQCMCFNLCWMKCWQSESGLGDCLVLMHEFFITVLVISFRSCAELFWTSSQISSN